MTNTQISNSDGYSEESSRSGSELSEEEEEAPPPIPSVIANWWLNENLGSGYSGTIS